MIARLATEADVDAILEAYGRAYLFCAPGLGSPAAAHVIADVMDRLVYVAYDGDAVAGTVIMDRSRPDFVWWFSPIDPRVTETWAALGDAVAEHRGVEPHGHVHNETLRRIMLTHPRMTADPEDDTHIIWRKP